MRTIQVKAISYYKNGKLINRPGFIKRITPKLVKSARRNLSKGRFKWSEMSAIQRVRNKGQVFKVIGKQLNISKIPKLIKK